MFSVDGRRSATFVEALQRSSVSRSLHIDRERHKSGTVRHLMRTGWLPDQHGAWPMAITPPIVGAVLGGWAWFHFPLFLAWSAAFMLFNVMTIWFKAAKRRRRGYVAAICTWGTATVILGCVVVAFMPRILTWAWLFIPLFGATVYELSHKRERSMLARGCTVITSALMCAVAFDVSTGLVRYSPQERWADLFPWRDSLLRAESIRPHGLLASTHHPWIHVWAVVALLLIMFIGSVAHVRCLIRERNNPTWIGASIIVHCVAVIPLTLACAHGILPIPVGMAWMLCTGRACVMPIMSRQRRLPATVIGITEILVSNIMIITIVLGFALAFS